MQSFLKEIGRGKRGAQDLRYEEAAQAVEWMVDDRATSAQIGAFFMAARMKGETVDELRGFVDVLRGASRLLSPNRPVHLEIGGPYDGRDRTFSSTVASALVLSAAGFSIALTGSETLPPKYGVTVLDILKAMGMPVIPLSGVDRQDQAARFAERSLDKLGIGYLHLDDLCFPLAGLRPIRLQLGFRTLLCTVEKYLNLSQSERLITGIFHGNAMETMGQLVQGLGYPNALVVQGPEGSGEFDCAHRTRYLRVTPDALRPEMLDPRELGLMADEEGTTPVTTPGEQARRTLAVLHGQSGLDRDRVCLNVAAQLRFLEATPDLESGLELARKLLDSQEALRLWEAWKTQHIALL
ncbi:MAG TPA: hypothetical protein V6D05_16745 [Stenomitos sp.]